ncbi:uncharacterized protein FFNC_15515 [Fusarium fujikuroi]|nr:uncharacterized protein FFNC_15515 [Fusarium fujikuroi]
MYTSKECIYK